MPAPRTKVILAVVAHADDLEFMAGGTVARLAGEKGHTVYEYILTDNSKGSYRLSPEEIIPISEAEARRAAEILGIRDVFFERYPDGELDQVNPAVLRGKIMAKIREVRADVVMSWDPFAPGEDHPDHRCVAMATLEAASFAGNPRFYPDHAHPPCAVTEAYWFAKHPTADADLLVDISSVMDKKISALLAHDCQMVLTADALAMEARAAGADLGLDDVVESGRYRDLIEMSVRNYCAETGAAPGLQAAERFRYQKLGMLDTVLGLSTIQPDFS
ncbi:MAG TPA: PIG-L family deacetylase [Candidatus Hydrogenedentes bacterium]|nr:PIG-L family deacetylase [Candidatus Hydrogenedentota bacterium]